MPHITDPWYNIGVRSGVLGSLGKESLGLRALEHLELRVRHNTGGPKRLNRHTPPQPTNSNSAKNIAELAMCPHPPRVGVLGLRPKAKPQSPTCTSEALFLQLCAHSVVAAGALTAPRWRVFYETAVVSRRLRVLGCGLWGLGLRAGVF